VAGVQIPLTHLALDAAFALSRRAAARRTAKPLTLTLGLAANAAVRSQPVNGWETSMKDSRLQGPRKQSEESTMWRSWPVPVMRLGPDGLPRRRPSAAGKRTWERARGGCPGQSTNPQRSLSPSGRILDLRHRLLDARRRRGTTRTVVGRRCATGVVECTAAWAPSRERRKVWREAKRRAGHTGGV